MTIQYQFADYTFDASRGLGFAGKPVHLPPKEKGLLLTLLQARGQIVRKDALATAVWGPAAASDESISRTVYRLRLTMQACGGTDVIETVYNSGFRITAAIRIRNPQESSAINSLTSCAQPGAIAALISAREYMARRSAEDLEVAVHAARQAIGIDPGYSAAWTTLAEVRVFQAIWSLRPPREAGWLAKEAAQSALRLDPDCAGALATRGWVRTMIDLEGESGLAELDIAYERDPDSWLVALYRGWACQAVGRQSEAVEMMRQALALNALGHSVNATLALYLLFAGQADEAVSEARTLASRFPTVDAAQCIACTVCAALSLNEEALSYGRRAVALSPGTAAAHAPLAYALAHTGQHREARAVLARMEACNSPEPSACTAPVYLALGERETAISRLRDARERGVPQFAWTRDDPRLASLHDDPALLGLWGPVTSHNT